MKVSDIQQYTDQELEAMIQENKQKLSETKFNNRISPVENPAKMRLMRRDIARMKTVLNQRKADNTAS